MLTSASKIPVPARAAGALAIYDNLLVTKGSFRPRVSIAVDGVLTSIPLHEAFPSFEGVHPTKGERVVLNRKSLKAKFTKSEGLVILVPEVGEIELSFRSMRHGSKEQMMLLSPEQGVAVLIHGGVKFSVKSVCDSETIVRAYF